MTISTSGNTQTLQAAKNNSVNPSNYGYPGPCWAEPQKWGEVSGMIFTKTTFLASPEYTIVDACK